MSQSDDFMRLPEDVRNDLYREFHSVSYIYILLLFTSFYPFPLAKLKGLLSYVFFNFFFIY